MPIKSELRGLTLIFVGDFNPTIFQPTWFSAQGMLTSEEAKEAVIQIIHPDVAVFELPWMSLTVERERFQAVCAAQPYFERVVGIACQTFGLLSHTPLRMLGINSEAHFRASSLEKWHDLGHKLAPKEFWKELYASPGMQSLTIRQDRPGEEERGGYSQVTVEPSVKVRPGVYVRLNEHYQAKPAEGPLGAKEMTDALKNNWTIVNEFADKVFAKIAGEL
jgi:hypothetical protein